MADAGKQATTFIVPIITGIISLVVGVAGGVILNYFTERKPILQYAVVASEVFSGTTQNSAILAIETANPGLKELENVRIQIALPNAKIVEYKIVGLPSTAFTAAPQEKALVVDIPFFNPSEKVSVQLFVALSASNFEAPSIEVRAKGITATQSQTLKRDKDSVSRLTLLGTAAMALVPPLVMFWYRKRRQYTTSHSDDQREVFAYILSINGLHDAANDARNSPRSLSYWSHADAVTEQCLKTNSPDQIQKGIKAFKDLMYYAAVAETSRMLINFDVAWLAASIGDVDTARVHLKRALVVNHEVIKKRISFEPRLVQIAREIGYEIAPA